MSVDLLPDSRASTVLTPKGAIMGEMGWMVPIYCANCGIEGGLVPQENMTFAFWVCGPKANNCAAKLGPLTHTMAIPDEVFYEQVKQEQLAKYGRILSNEELQRVADEDASPLATLLNRR